MMFKQSMKVQDYEVWVHLGCLSDEQTHAQPVHVTIDIEFEQNLFGSENDRLEDAVDYVALTEVVKIQAQKKKYHLIEHLCSEISKNIFNKLQNQKIKGLLVVQVKKIRVPVENLRNGVIYKCEIKL